MARMFVIACPECSKKFQANYEEFRHKPIKLLCPYCAHRFIDEESPTIDDRGKK